eukprot:363658-Chlamydomonas_euryale.AAC.1
MVGTVHRSEQPWCKQCNVECPFPCLSFFASVFHLASGGRISGVTGAGGCAGWSAALHNKASRKLKFMCVTFALNDIGEQ